MYGKSKRKRSTISSLQVSPSQASEKPTKRSGSSKMKYHLVASALTFILNLACINRSNAVPIANDSAPIYVMIIDAGSTASRLNLYEFHNRSGQLVLEDSLFLETKPGLSSFAKTPEEIERSLDVLLEKARTRIPRSLWVDTPLALRATAGLRLLPEDESRAILRECERVFASSGFEVDDESVAVMNGTDEGIFSWFTANFLLDRFASGKTVAAFDLGGGSTQVTYAIAEGSAQANDVSTSIGNVSVFTESFLGMGLNAARKKILAYDRKTLDVWSVCVDPDVSGLEWNYAGETYVVSGAYVGFSECLGVVEKVVRSAIPRDLPSVEGHEVYAFSFYFERAADAGLVDSVAGGTVKVEAIRKRASEVCDNPEDNEPFMCLDLTFMYALLHDGFGIDESSNVSMRETINGHQLNWALGAAYNLLQSRG